MLAVYVLLAVFLLGSGQISVETSQYATEDECAAAAEALRAFLTSHETEVVSATWKCSELSLIQPPVQQPAPKQNL